MKSEFGDHDSSEMQQALRAGLEKMKAGEALDHAFRQSKDLEQFTRQMHTWFDAFRTLKLIHFLRDHALPSVSYDGLGEGRDFVRRVKETGSKGLSDGL